MNQRAVSWGDVLRLRRGSRFVGRRQEVEAFRLNCLYDVPQSLLFVLKGPPGIGKSALLDQYQAIANEHGVVPAVVSLRDRHLGGAYAPIAIMQALAQPLAKAGVPLTTFREILGDYNVVLRETSGDDAVPGPPWALFGGLRDKDAWVARGWDDYLTTHVAVRGIRLLQNPVASLTERFVQDLNAWATVRRIVLIFDDWQLVPAAFDTWLRALLTQGELSTRIWCVLATREPLSPGWQLLSPVTTVTELEPLSYSDSRAMLMARGVADVPALEERLELAQGQPLSLALLAELPDDVALSDASTSIEAYLAALSPAQKTTLVKCVAARTFDPEVLSVLLIDALGERADASGAALDDQVAEAIAFLEGSPLVVSTPVRERLHEAVWEPLAIWAQEMAPEIWRAAHERLVAYRRQQLELQGETVRYLDADWREAQAALLYHQLVLADLASVGLDAALLSFADAVRQFSPWAATVLSIWREAASISDPAGFVATWLEDVESLSGALFAGDWERATVLLDRILLAPGWSAEVLQSLRSLQQAVASRFTVAPKSQSPYEGASGEVPVALETLAAAQAKAAEGSTRREVAAEVESVTPQDVRSETPRDQVEPVATYDTDGPSQPDPEVTSTAEPEASAVEHCSYANQKLAAGDYQAAIQAYDQALALDPGYVAARYNRGLAYARLGALDRAVADFTHVIERDAGRVGAYHQRGLAYARQGRLERAVADFNAALTLSPDAVAIAYARANALFRLNAYERAIEDYSAVLAQEPKRADVYLNRGLARVALGNYTEALRDYNQAIALDPDRSAAYSHRGKAYVYLERYSEALSDYERAVELDPRQASVYNNLGLLYVRIEAYPQAIEAYQHAMALQPDWPTAYYNAACAAALMADIEHATVWLSRAVSLRERYRHMALSDPDFAGIRDASQFQAIVAPTTTAA